MGSWGGFEPNCLTLRKPPTSAFQTETKDLTNPQSVLPMVRDTKLLATLLITQLNAITAMLDCYQKAEIAVFPLLDRIDQ